ncbi:MAG: hypothetical protein FWF92_00215 [Oscillospiraceae bacterium]|nr:hypothetical protein [Oscillospiraceae bacterium]
MKRLNIMFASEENFNKWIYNRSDWEQTRKDLNMTEVINYFEKSSKDFPAEYLYKPCLEQTDADYRLEIMDELLADGELFKNISDFCILIRRFKMLLRDFKEEKHEIQKQYRFLLLCGEFTVIAGNLKIILSEAKSGGLKALYDFCSEITGDEKIKFMDKESGCLINEINIILKNTGTAINRAEKILTVIDCEEAGEADLLKEEIFDLYGIKIKDGFSIVDPLPLSYLEEKVLGILIENHEETFLNLKAFFDVYNSDGQIMDNIKIIADLLPQFIFYITYLEFVKNAGQNRLPVCRPVFGEDGFYAVDGAGIALIIKFFAEKYPVENIICNDIKLPKSGTFILSGPNQGGKTIYLKMAGSSAYLAKCGCYVFCRECRLPFYDNILTHFLQKEILGKSRLIEEIERIEVLSRQFSRDSLVLLNESFTSTRRKDSVDIAVHYIKKFDETGCSVGFVSHFYEIPEIYKNGENNIISLRSGIGENGMRTYKISEQKGDGFAYARDIAQNCGMTYKQLIADITNNIKTAGKK